MLRTAESQAIKIVARKIFGCYLQTLNPYNRGRHGLR